MKSENIFIRAYRYVYNIVDSFFNDDTTYYAASLSFFTIFSLLPIIALLLSIISNIHFFNQYVDEFLILILDILNPSHSEQFVSFFKNFLSNTTKLGYVGIAYMIVIFTMFFKDYEYIVNKIHETKRKSIYTSFLFYLVFLTTMPIIFAIFIIIQSFYSNDIFNIVLAFLFAWGIIYWLFKYSVNKQISIKSALISSLITTFTLSITKNMFVYYILYNKTYTTIYGSFATLMFFFFWIYVSWIIYLYGIKMCYKLNIKANLPQADS